MSFLSGSEGNYLQSHHFLPSTPPPIPDHSPSLIRKHYFRKHQLGTERKGSALRQLALSQAKRIYVNLLRHCPACGRTRVPSLSGVKLLLTHCQGGISQAASLPSETGCNRLYPLPRQPNVTSKEPPEWPSVPAMPMFMQCGQE